LGTLGGPASYYSAQGVGSLILNERGAVAGYGDTADPDPYFPNCFDPDCYLAHAFRFQNGVFTDLGALPGTNSSAMSAINERGWVSGFSENGITDPVLNAPAAHGVLWTDHRIIDLGTLGGYQSNASYVNDSGQVVGFSTINTDPDPYSFLGTPFHTFLWQNGTMLDIGTLGGPDAGPSQGGINQRRSMIAGASFTSDIPNPGTGIPTQDPFLWKNGVMTDLGTLGGTIGAAQAANNRGQVIGASNLAGDLISHGFFWDRGVLTDLGTLGGDNVIANWINDDGEVVGRSDTSVPGIFHAFLWKRGGIQDLGVVGTDPCTNARAINSHEQIVGSGSDCVHPLHAFLSEDDGPLVDLNTLVSEGPDFQVLIAYNINERGEIAGTGVPAGCDRVDTCGHVFLMIPCDENHPGECRDYSIVETPASGSAQPPRLPPHFMAGPKSTVPRLDSMGSQFRHTRILGQRAAPLE
jgi:probable HAF family extracellular repeat protein